MDRYIDGISGKGRDARSYQVLGNGLALTPQEVMGQNNRRLYACITNDSTHEQHLQFGAPGALEGGVGTDFVDSLVLQPHQSLILEKDDVRGGCEWTGSIWAQGAAALDTFAVLEVSDR